MAVRIEHGRPSTIIQAAKRAGEAQAALRAQEQAERLQAQQREFEYRTALAQQDMAIDLQMNERAKLWEIQKMELRSQVDFQREEQQRQRKLDSADNAIQQIDKEVLAGRMTEQEAYPIKQKLELSKIGVSIPVSAFPGDEEDRYGVRPYYTDPEFERDYPELAAAKKREITEGRTGTVPYHLSPEFLRTLPPSTAIDMLANKGIFFDSDEDFEEWLVNLESVAPTELPLSDKSFDIGVRAEQPELIFKGYGKETQVGVSPLSATVARQILIEVGGDKERARDIARSRGFSF